MKKPSSITVIGKRWFQKTYGNTYFSAVILVDGKEVANNPYEYGYGDQYLQWAREWLFENGYLVGEERKIGSLSLYCRENGIEFSYSVSDVSRKKDL